MGICDAHDELSHACQEIRSDVKGLLERMARLETRIYLAWGAMTLFLSFIVPIVGETVRRVMR